MTTARTLFALAATALSILAAPAAGSARPNPHAELDCSYCHFDTPRFGVDTRATVNFWRAEGDEPHLCERCHGPEANFHPLGVVPGPERLGTRLPKRLPLGKTEAVRDQVVCTTCHFVHAADADFALLRGFPGSEDPKAFRVWQDLCRECHGESLEKRSPHAADERACAFCHTARPQPGQPVTVTTQGHKLCEFCHGAKDPAHYAGVNPFAQPQECTGCHDPHLGKDHPARLKKGFFDPIRESVALNPHRKRTLCFACHEDESAGTLLNADVVALCQRCHGSGKIPGMSHPLTKVPPGYTVPKGWPLAGGALTCLTCHLPGHSADSGTVHLLRESSAYRTEVCFACHRRDQWTGVDPHSEAAKERKGCLRCHARQPDWASDNAGTVTFIADINIICLACHDQGSHPGGVNHTVTVKEGSPRKVPEALPLGPGRRITCATCHNPHIDPPAGYRLRGISEPAAFCSRCHNF